MRNILVLTTNPHLITTLSRRLQDAEQGIVVTVAVDRASLRQLDTPVDCVVVDMDDRDTVALLETLDDVAYVAPETRILACTRRKSATSGSELWELERVGRELVTADDLAQTVGAQLSYHKARD